mgnify:CR=1 FL=1
MALKVLMVGGRRCGKTSALAVMFEQMINGKANEFFTISDDSKYDESQGDEKQDTLTAKTTELKLFLVKPTTYTFLVDQEPTRTSWKYICKLTLPGKKAKHFEIEYTDVPGEWWRSGTTHSPVINQYVAEHDVFVVMVDTPYLMETSAPMCEAVNCISDIHNALTYIDDKKGTKAKMVVFVPIKCEKWVKEGRIKEVTDKVREAYSTPIRALMAYKKMSVCILPIETAGNIFFREFKEAFLLNGEKCCQLSNSMVRMGNGKPKNLRTNDILNPDPEAVMGALGIMRPYAWFYANNKSATPGYAPRNCDQLALHILKFYVKKYQMENAHGVFWSRLFGTISKEEMLRKMQEINASGIIKENVDGIEYLNRAY